MYKLLQPNIDRDDDEDEIQPAKYSVTVVETISQ